MRLSSRLNCAPWTDPSCFIAGPICAPVAASHSRSVPSPDHDRMRLPSRLNRAPLTNPSCFIGGPICGARRRVPQPQRVVIRPRQDAASRPG